MNGGSLKIVIHDLDDLGHTHDLGNLHIRQNWASYASDTRPWLLLSLIYCQDDHYKYQ